MLFSQSAKKFLPPSLVEHIRLSKKLNLLFTHKYINVLNYQWFVVAMSALKCNYKPIPNMSGFRYIV